LISINVDRIFYFFFKLSFRNTFHFIDYYQYPTLKFDNSFKNARPRNQQQQQQQQHSTLTKTIQVNLTPTRSPKTAHNSIQSTLFSCGLCRRLDHTLGSAGLRGDLLDNRLVRLPHINNALRLAHLQILPRLHTAVNIGLDGQTRPLIPRLNHPRVTPLIVIIDVRDDIPGQRILVTNSATTTRRNQQVTVDLGLQLRRRHVPTFLERLAELVALGGLQLDVGRHQHLLPPKERGIASHSLLLLAARRGSRALLVLLLDLAVGLGVLALVPHRLAAQLRLLVRAHVARVVPEASGHSAHTARLTLHLHLCTYVDGQ